MRMRGALYGNSTTSLVQSSPLRKKKWGNYKKSTSKLIIKLVCQVLS